jgi:hypothetical protein
MKNERQRKQFFFEKRAKKPMRLLAGGCGEEWAYDAASYLALSSIA